MLFLAEVRSVLAPCPCARPGHSGAVEFRRSGQGVSGRVSGASATPLGSAMASLLPGFGVRLAPAFLEVPKQAAPGEGPLLPCGLLAGSRHRHPLCGAHIVSLARTLPR